MSEFDNLDKDKVKTVRERVDIDSKRLEEIVEEIVEPYTSDLDRYVNFISGVLKDGENPPTSQELDDFCLNLSVYLYYAGAMQEHLGIRDDISKAIYKEMYNSSRQDNGKGTVADKNAFAELAAQQEYLTSVCYKRAYNIAGAKVEAGQELLASCKKVLSRRMQEFEITRMGGK